ncbi:Hsp20 family protein [Saccharibacter sp. 17.LH.SD]|uniref:Hsp20 family protein n=1 Tax=Saccharibacter sp. 17.LH.SD TaxID=2689393 RepID=UPI00136B9B56|nr:Hsp20 family protein [Saccharibacter sp. 17.LH.SD]MXV44421.1 Hsp20 family protein [Saccharibacter sp. 17.LH.SD]
MRSTVDFSPLFRSSVGFERILNALEGSNRLQAEDNWPPYDIMKTGEDDYRIEMAIAGFKESDLTLVQERNVLVVAGRKTGEPQENVEYLHRGIAGREFERRFNLADHMKVIRACFENGLLTITLKREIPEAMKPRHIEIMSAQAPSRSDTAKIEAKEKAG